MIKCVLFLLVNRSPSLLLPIVRISVTSPVKSQEFYYCANLNRGLKYFKWFVIVKKFPSGLSLRSLFGRKVCIVHSLTY